MRNIQPIFQQNYLKTNWILFTNFEAVSSYFSNSGKRNLVIHTWRSESLWRFIYTERQSSGTTLLIVILFQTIMAFENNELSLKRQVISNRFYESAVTLSSPLSQWRNSQTC